MKRILVFNAGGSPSTNFIRSLRDAPEDYYIIGLDCNKYYIMRSEADENYLIPEFAHPKYFKVINKLIEEKEIDFIHIQNDFELQNFVNNIDKINLTKAKIFLPETDTINTCIDKYESYKLWKKHGLPQPETLMLNNESDLKECLDKFGKIWIRDIEGAGGRGSISTDDFKVAKNWIDFNNGWGHYTGADCLTPDSVTWMSIWKDGKLIVAQSRARAYWELSKLSPSGISGATGTGITLDDKKVNEIAMKTIEAIDSKPNGIFSVDMAYDRNGIPNPTEINIGRFFTTHYFFTVCGLNMPHIYLKTCFGEDVELPKNKVNPLPSGLCWIRGMDFEPTLCSVKDINNNIDGYEKMLDDV